VYVGADCPPVCLDREGIVKCNVLPTRKLYHPVLPYKCNSKLMFSWCCAFANTMNQDSCTHSYEERCIVGTWIVDGVRKAVDMGYGLVDMFEFWGILSRVLTMVPIQVAFLRNILTCS